MIKKICALSLLSTILLSNSLDLEQNKNIDNSLPLAKQETLALIDSVVAKYSDLKICVENSLDYKTFNNCVSIFHDTKLTNEDEGVSFNEAINQDNILKDDKTVVNNKLELNNNSNVELKFEDAIKK